MGKATKWLKSLLRMKNHHEKDKTPLQITNMSNNNIIRNEIMVSEKMGIVGLEKRQSFANSKRDFVSNKENINQNKSLKNYINDDIENEQSKHAVAVATATAAAADAAFAAAQAALEVVRLTTKNRGPLFVKGGGSRDKWVFAAVKIQSFFRGYLARRAHRALKGLVKLQAVVRGFLVRKRAAVTLHSMQALFRAQATVRSHQVDRSFTKHSNFHSEFRPRQSIDMFAETKNIQFHSKRLSTSYDSNNPHEGSPKIVEIDTYKPRSRSRRIINNPTVYDFGGDEFQYPTMSSPLPYPMPSRVKTGHHIGYDWTVYGDEYQASTAQSTPRFTNPIRLNELPTPTKSICSNHPSYMADTKSFRAKLRSQSAPKQRPEGRAKKAMSLHEIMAARTSISGVRMQRSCSQVQ